MENQLEYHFPVIRYHSAWSELKTENLYRVLNGRKGAVSYNSFLTINEDCSDYLAAVEDRTPLEAEESRVLEELLDYCTKEDVRILFVVAPQQTKQTDILGKYNTIVDILEEREFSVLQAEKMISEIGLDPSSDYYNNGHTNIHGSLKYTYFLANYLSEHYDFTDKRKTPGYEDWDASYTWFESDIAKNTLEFERLNCKRDYSLKAVTLTSCASSDQSLHISWEKSNSAEGYAVYRKIKSDGIWELILLADGQTFSLLDEELENGIEYKYIIVPIRWEGQTIVYGNYDIKGISGIPEPDDK